MRRPGIHARKLAQARSKLARWREVLDDVAAGLASARQVPESSARATMLAALRRRRIQATAAVERYQVTVALLEAEAALAAATTPEGKARAAAARDSVLDERERRLLARAGTAGTEGTAT